MSSNTTDNLTNTLELGPSERKRRSDDGIPGLQPPSKRERMVSSTLFSYFILVLLISYSLLLNHNVPKDPANYFPEEADVHEEAVDFALGLLQKEHDQHDPREPSLEFSVAPHR